MSTSLASGLLVRWLKTYLQSQNQLQKKGVYRVSPMPKYSVLLSTVLLWQKWFGNCRFVCVRGRPRWLFWGGRGGAKENVLRFQVPVVQWVDSTTYWINLCLCPVDNAIMVSLILIYWLVPTIFFNNRGHISRVWHIKVGLNKIWPTITLIFFMGSPRMK